MQLFFVKLRVRIDMFSIRFRIWYSYIQKRGNATPHVQELVASSVWVGQFIRVFGIFLYGSEVDARVSRFRPDNEAQVRCGHENRAWKPHNHAQGMKMPVFMPSKKFHLKFMPSFQPPPFLILREVLREVSLSLRIKEFRIIFSPINGT